VNVLALRHTLAVLAAGLVQTVSLDDRDTLEPLRQDRSGCQSRQAAAKHECVLTDLRHGRLSPPGRGSLRHQTARQASIVSLVIA
jgi:hypothetical protein